MCNKEYLRTEFYDFFPVVLYYVKSKISDSNILTSKIIFLNRVIEDLTGWSIEEIKKDSNWWFNNVHKDDVAGVLEQNSKILSGNLNELTLKYRFKKKDGEYLYIQDSFSVVSKKSDEIEIVGTWRDIGVELEYEDLFAAIKYNPQMGVLIFSKEKLLFINDAMKNLMGVSDKNTIDIDITRIFNLYDMVDSQINKLATKEITVKTLDEKIKELSVYFNKIKFKGHQANLVFAIDITEKKRLEVLNIILKGINNIIISSENESELFEGICEFLVENGKFTLVWVGEADFDKKIIFPKYVYGKEKDYVKNIKIVFDEKVPEGNGPTAKAFREGKITINKDTRVNNSVLPWRDKMLKRNFLSSCAIPIMKNGKYTYILNIYSDIPEFFNEELLTVLDEIRKDINFILDKLENDKKRLILSHALENSKDWVLITEADGTIIYVNNAVEEISGYKKKELLGKKPDVLKSGFHDENFYSSMWKQIGSGNVFKGVIINRKKNGDLFQLEHTIVPVIVNSKVVNYVSVAKDITKEAFLEREILKFKYKDLLTNLYNRNGFLKEMQKELKKYIGVKPIGVLLVIDVCNFSHINKIYGDDTGNNILKFIADKLTSNFYDEDIIGRTGSDEFALFLRLKNENEITQVINKIFNLFEGIVIIDNHKINLSINVGASVNRSVSNILPEALFNQAITALSLAKKEGENKFKFYDEIVNDFVLEHYNTSLLIREALEKEWFILHLQPFYNTVTGAIAGFEALIRINHPETGLIYPSKFINILENSEYLLKVEKWIIKTAVKYLKQWGKRFKLKLPISINISATSFKDKKVIELLEEVKDFSSFLYVELTERIFIDNIIDVKKLMLELKNMGFKIIIDDFGTGYSSLSYLSTMPIDKVKIDISFVRQMLVDKKQLALVDSIIGLSKKLDMKTLAEGVETSEQFNTLKDLGCDFVQGYYFSKPINFADTFRIISKNLK